MRLSELSGKEMVDFKKAERLGVLGSTTLKLMKRAEKWSASNHPGRKAV